VARIASCGYPKGVVANQPIETFRFRRPVRGGSAWPTASSG